ncbi:hypothetical protein B0O80DRAFT_502156 [Mortierella sp. GBAus27b]|nr:hypothetical protein B0O80DRAFT_502156 [Mortierella sp. GBAus27b]
MLPSHGLWHDNIIAIAFGNNMQLPDVKAMILLSSLSAAADMDVTRYATHMASIAPLTGNFHDWTRLWVDLDGESALA